MVTPLEFEGGDIF